MKDIKERRAWRDLCIFRWVPALAAISFVGLAAAPPSLATETTIEQMPAKLETQFALGAVPPGLRDRAAVYLPDREKGYEFYGRERTA
jgi:hypothetical protein